MFDYGSVVVSYTDLAVAAGIEPATSVIADGALPVEVSVLCATGAFLLQGLLAGEQAITEQ